MCGGLLTIIDWFSRYLIAFDLVPTVNASHVQTLYRQGLQTQRIPFNAEQKPELRVDRGSPNTSRVTQAFFQDLDAELSFARVRRPTDNAITERFYGSLKQEEVYVVGNYPDARSAREEIGRYIEEYNTASPASSVDELHARVCASDQQQNGAGPGKTGPQASRAGQTTSLLASSLPTPPRR